MNSRFPSSRTPSGRPYISEQDVGVNAPTATTQAVALIPEIFTGDIEVDATVGVVRSAGFSPEVFTTIGIYIEPPTAQAQASGLEPRVRAATDKSVNAPVAESEAGGLDPSVLTTSGVHVAIPAAKVSVSGYAPSVEKTRYITLDMPVARCNIEGEIPVITSAEGTTLVFKGRDIKDAAPTDTEIKIIRVIRPLKKPLSSHKIEIPARAGSWDFECGVEQDYNITVEIVIITDTAENIMLCAKAIETYLDGKGQVRFTDDTAIHQGQIYQGVYIYSDLVGNYGTATLVFECDAA